jgi:hypothetical protein
MHAAAWIVLASGLLAQGASGEPPEVLVARLGAASYAERERAAAVLERLGRDALPALRGAERSRDLEIRTRAAAILHRIEAALLVRPTMVRLDFRDQPRSRILAELSRQTGFRLELSAPQAAGADEPRATLVHPEPLPFWKAIDEFCLATGLNYDPEPLGLAVGGEPTLTFSDQIRRPLDPTSDHGPFRVSVVGLQFLHDVRFAILEPPGDGGPEDKRPLLAPPPDRFSLRPKPVMSEQCWVRFRITAEPRLAISQIGPLRLLQARDDRGSSLREETADALVWNSTIGVLGASCDTALHLQEPIRRPPIPGTTITILQGTVPLKISSRRPDPLVVPLPTAQGRSFRKGGTRIVIHAVPAGDPRHGHLELTLETEASGDPTPPLDAPPPNFATAADSLHRRLEIVDAKGRPLSWIQTAEDLDTGRLTLSLNGPATESLPHELHYYELAETVLDLPFTFSDLPMP